MSLSHVVNAWNGDHASDSEELLVLLAMANACDQDGRCFSNVAKICQKTLLEETNVIQCLQRLCERSVIEKRDRFYFLVALHEAGF